MIDHTHSRVDMPSRYTCRDPYAERKAWIKSLIHLCDNQAKPETTHPLPIRNPRTGQSGRMVISQLYKQENKEKLTPFEVGETLVFEESTA